MVDLGHVTAEELRAALEEVEEKKPTQRLTAAIAHKNGITQTEIASWYGVERKTVYNWLSRFGSRSESFAEAARDDQSPGRPRRLSEDQFDKLYRRLQQAPAEAGYDATAWTPEMVRDLIEDRWNVRYSRWSCLRFLKEAGLSYQTSRRGKTEADPEERGRFRENDSKNSAGGWTHRRYSRSDEDIDTC